MKLRPYPQYKESGVPWLGSIPAHWETTKLKRVSQVQSGVTLGKSYNNSPLTEYPYLRVANVQNGFLNLKHVKTMAVPENEVTSSRLLPGDVVVTEGGDIDKLGRGAIWNGEIENCLHQNHIFAIRPTKNRLSPSFLARTLESHHGRSYFYLTAKRTTNLAATNQTTLGLLPLFLPTVDEQTQIARFLDWKATQINKFIRNKRRLIELLKEQKQNVINQAVTRGLDPNVKLKSSGVEWIGDIPEHWEVRRLKFLSKGMLQYGANEQSGQQDLGCPRYVRITDIKDSGELRDDTLCTIPKDIAEPYLLREGDILFARSGATVGKTFCYQRSWGQAAYAGYLIRATIDAKIINHEFVFQFTRSRSYLNWIGSSFIKATIQNISAEKYASLWITLPPREEQELILDFIKSESELIDQAITRAQRKIELMREYRARLISDVVTGQVDVRGIEVPEVAEEELPVQDEDVSEFDDGLDEDLAVEDEP